ncbi:hypothetical protein RA210_U10361 [Rubrivivax sp. A210]|nr:hypothetical protein RA210_U10361 [Rubrivivax sp. A210]
MVIRDVVLRKDVFYVNAKLCL